MAVVIPAHRHDLLLGLHTVVAGQLCRVVQRDLPSLLLTRASHRQAFGQGCSRIVDERARVASAANLALRLTDRIQLRLHLRGLVTPIEHVLRS